MFHFPSILICYLIGVGRHLCGENGNCYFDYDLGFLFQDLESEIEVIFPRPKPPTPPADSEQAKSDEESKKEGNCHT